MPRSNRVPDTVRLPATLILVPGVKETELDILKLLNVVVELPPNVWVAPLKFTVPVPPVKVPLLVQVPDTVSVLLPPSNVP